MPEGGTLRTEFEMTKRLFGAKWLPNATLDEYAVASWFEEYGWKGRYQFQSPVGDFRNQLWTDFRLLGTPICIEVNGDKWHSAPEQQAADHRRMILLAQQGMLIVPVFGHDIYAYRGREIPTDDTFNRIMRWAVQGIVLSKP